MNAAKNEGSRSSPPRYHQAYDLPTGYWKSPLALTIFIHLSVFILLVSGPSLFRRKPYFPDVYTVDLFSVAELSSSAPGAKTATAPSSETAKTVLPDAISLRPRDRNGKKVQQALLERKLRQMQAKVEEKKARQKAEKALKEALSGIKELLKSEMAGKAAGGNDAETVSGGAGRAGSASAMNDVERRYYAATINHIQKHWVLPDLQDWQKDLEAVLVVTIRRDGVVTGSSFDKKTDNIYFNQFVEKTIQEASPLPPFPPEFQESSREIGLRFRPREIL